MKKITFLIAALLPLVSFAGGFQLNLQGIKAVAMGGAFVGVNSDASSVFFNPGGMSNLNGHNFTVGFNLIDPHVSMQTAETANIDQTSSIATPIQFYYVGQVTDKLNFGFLVNNQFGSSSSFEDDWQGRYIVQNISLKTFMFQPTVSYKIFDKLSIGGGLMYTRGSFDTEKAVPVASSNTTEGKVSLEGSGDGVGYNIGIYSQFYTLEKESSKTKFAVGVDYRSEMPIDLNNGEAVFTDIPNSLKSKFPAKTSFTSKLTLPSVFTFGVSAKHIKNDKWSLELVYDLNYTGWSSYDTLAFNFDNNDTPDSKVVKDWENVLTHRIGADFTYLSKYSVRAGLYIDNTPMKDGFVSPELPGMTQTAYTAGLGYKLNENFSVDFSYIRQNADREAALDQSNWNAKYKRKVNVYGLAINIKIGGGNKDESVPSIE